MGMPQWNQRPPCHYLLREGFAQLEASCVCSGVVVNRRKELKLILKSRVYIGIRACLQQAQQPASVAEELPRRVAHAKSDHDTSTLHALANRRTVNCMIEYKQ